MDSFFTDTPANVIKPKKKSNQPSDFDEFSQALGMGAMQSTPEIDWDNFTLDPPKPKQSEEIDWDNFMNESSENLEITPPEINFSIPPEEKRQKLGLGEKISQYSKDIAKGQVTPIDPLARAGKAVFEFTQLDDIFGAMARAGDAMGSKFDLKPILPKSVQSGITDAQKTFDQVADPIASKLSNNQYVNRAFSDALDASMVIPGLQGARLAKVATPKLAKKGILQAEKKLVQFKDKRLAAKHNEIKSLAGKIGQGADKNQVAATARVLTDIDTKKIKTYESFDREVKTQIKKFAQIQDEILAADKTKFARENFTRSVDLGDGKKASINYVDEALNSLDELYSTIGELEKRAVVNQARIKFNEQGLTKKEINDLARIYGAEGNSFTRAGELKSGRNAIAYEKTRKELKQSVRDLMDTNETKILDQKMSDLYSVQKNTERMVKEVQKLQNRMQERGFGEKVGGIVGTAVDTMTGNALGGFFRKIIVPRGGGLKLNNAINLQENLAKNLKDFSKLAKKKGVDASGLDDAINATRGSGKAPKSGENPKAEELQSSTKVIQNQSEKATPVKGGNKSSEKVKVGEFGPIYTQFKGKAKEAVQFLMRKKKGEVVGALSHREIGSIDIVWGKGGNKGYGLAKIAEKHPEVLDDLQSILQNSKIIDKTENRVRLESKTHKAVVNLKYKQEAKQWLLTAFEKSK